jgi:inorganic triphosphatase YgiF
LHVIEAELKILLDEAALRRLRRDSGRAALRLAPPTSRELVSVYYDTPDRDLAAAGIALRLRRSGRAWVQTIKRRAEATASGGFFAHEENEIPAPDGRLVLDGPDPEGALADVVAAAGGRPLSPVFETRVTRRTERLRGPEGGEVELALDSGEIRAGQASEPIREAELELVSGSLADIFGLARSLFPHGPVRLGTENKATRGYRLAAGKAPSDPTPRKAGDLEVAPDTTIEIAARDVFRDCLAQIAANMVVVAETDLSEGPHQLRVGLRRLRTAFSVFGPVLGEASMQPLADTAQSLGRTVGHLRDADVLRDEVVAGAAAGGLDAAAAGALADALGAHRETVRAEVRAALAGETATGFLFDLGLFIEGRGWLDPADHTQTARLATPVADVAPALLDRQLKRVRKRGRHFRRLHAEGLHELRKSLKKLRYAVDMLGPAFPAERVASYLGTLKELQDSFGSMNDAAMAGEALSGPDAPAADDPAAQRAVGWTLGTLAARVAEDHRALERGWRHLKAAPPFWR